MRTAMLIGAFVIASLTGAVVLNTVLTGEDVQAEDKGITAAGTSARAPSPEEEIGAVRARMMSVMQEAPDSVTATPVKGLYQVSYGPMVFYLSGDGRYLMKGNMIDLVEQLDLTEASRNILRKSVIDKVSEDKMIVYSPEKPRHTITVFTDIDCPFCRRLHQEMEELNQRDIKVRYLFFPRAGVGSPAYGAAVSVWCAADQEKALTLAKIEGKIEPKSCDNPINEHMHMVEEMGITGTPAIILEDGTLISGYRPAKQLADFLDQQSVARQAAASAAPVGPVR